MEDGIRQYHCWQAEEYFKSWVDQLPFSNCKDSWKSCPDGVVLEKKCVKGAEFVVQERRGVRNARKEEHCCTRRDVTNFLGLGYYAW